MDPIQKYIFEFKLNWRYSSQYMKTVLGVVTVVMFSIGNVHMYVSAITYVPDSYFSL